MTCLWKSICPPAACTNYRARRYLPTFMLDQRNLSAKPDTIPNRPPGNGSTVCRDKTKRCYGHVFGNNASARCEPRRRCLLLYPLQLLVTLHKNEHVSYPQILNLSTESLSDTHHHTKFTWISVYQGKTFVEEPQERYLVLLDWCKLMEFYRLDIPVLIIVL